MYWQVNFDNKSKKDAYLNGKIVEATVKRIDCRSGKSDSAILEYMDNGYDIFWLCDRYSEKVGDIINVKYSEKYDRVISMKYRYSEKLHIFFFVVFLFFHLLTVFSLIVYYKGIRIDKEGNIYYDT